MSNEALCHCGRPLRHMGRCTWRRAHAETLGVDGDTARARPEIASLGLDPSVRPSPERAPHPTIVIERSPKTVRKANPRALRLRRALDAVHTAAIEFSAAYRDWRRGGADLLGIPGALEDGESS